MSKKVSIPKKTGSTCNAKISEIGKVIDAHMNYIKKNKSPDYILFSIQDKLMNEYEPKCKLPFEDAVEKIVNNILTTVQTKCIPLSSSEEIVKCIEDIERKNPIIFYENIKNALVLDQVKKLQEEALVNLLGAEIGEAGEEERVPQEAIERNIWKEMFS